MVTEFDLPCADCDQELVRRQVAEAGDALTVAECPSCGGRYYPEGALSAGAGRAWRSEADPERRNLWQDSNYLKSY